MAREIPAEYDRCTPDEKLAKVYAANAGKLTRDECIKVMAERGEISPAEAEALRASAPADPRAALVADIVAEVRAQLTKGAE